MEYKIRLLQKNHIKSSFDSGEKSLNNYLHTQVSQDIKRSLSAAYVLLEANNPSVIGFYTLSSLSISLNDLSEKISKKLPRYPIAPVTLIGRLAIDKNYQKQRLGELLLVDALKRSYFQSTQIGSMAVVVDALNESATHFYEKFGFIKFLDRKGQLFITMESIKDL